MKLSLSPLVALAVVGAVTAQSVVVPAANATVRNNAQLNSIIRNAGNPRTYMLGTNASELAAIPPGAVIVGISLRFSVHTANTASWPAADVTWSDYQIWAGPAIPTATWTGAYFGNFSATPTQVRSGPMTLPAGSFSNLNPAGTTPNPWSEFYFAFQVPYVYAGGDLGLLFSHPGSNDPATAPYPETVPSDEATYGAGWYNLVYPPNSAGSRSTFYVHRLHYGYGSVCPGGGTAPIMVVNGDTVGGGTALFTLQNGPAMAPVAYVFGAGQTSIPLFNGCNLLTVPLVTASFLLDANGRFAAPVPVPAGVTGKLNAQGVAIVPGAPANLATSNGVEFTAK